VTTPFANPLTGAQGTLVRSQVKSPNFSLAGQAGWAILKDGSAFFFNVTATGTITATTFAGTDFFINSAGAFFYSGTPALGRLIYSIANTPGTDKFGNNYLGGGGVQYASSTPGGFYAFGTGVFVSGTNASGGLGLLHAATAGGPYAGLGGITIYSAGGGPAQLIVSDAGSVTPATSALAEIQGTLAALSAAISGASAAGGLLTVQNTTASPADATVKWAGAAAGDTMLAILVTGDTNDRFKIDTAGKHQWGSGSAGADTSLYRTSAGRQLAADPVLANISGSAETWHPVTYSNSWADGAGRTPSQYRLVASPASAVQMEGSLTIPAGFAAGQTIFTLPAGYRPATTKSMLGREVTRNTVVLFSISTAGLVAFQAASGAVAGDTIDFDRIFQTDI